MIALALALAVQGTPLPAEEPDIVVIGRRLAALSVRVGRDPQGRFTCGLSQSTGNARLDEQLCRTAAKCVKTGAIDQVAAAADARAVGQKLAEALQARDLPFDRGAAIGRGHATK